MSEYNSRVAKNMEDMEPSDTLIESSSRDLVVQDDSINQLSVQNDENAVANTIPNAHQVTVQGGNFHQPQLGPQYNEFKKQDGIIDSNFQGANFGTQNIKHIQNIQIFQNSQAFHTPTTSLAIEETRRTNTVSEDWVQLASNIGMFSSKRISKHGRVYEGAMTSDLCEPKPIAVKYSEYNEDNVKEAKLLNKLPPHENVVAMYHSDIHYQGPMKYMYIAMELCNEESLREYINTNKNSNVQFDSKLSISNSKMVVDGLHFIHKNGIIHRDLKPDNILLSLDRSVLKICDFGLSKQLEKGRSVTKQTMLRLGTDGYRAPETYNLGVISQLADIYSLALVLYYIWSNGGHPFGDDPDDWNGNIKRNKNRNFDGLLLPEKVIAIKLLESMLEFDPHNRPTTETILKNMIWYETESESVPQKTNPPKDAETSTIVEIEHVIHGKGIAKYYDGMEEKKFLEAVENAFNCKIKILSPTEQKKKCCSKISASFGPVMISIYHGDLTKETSDVILNSGGEVQKSIEKYAGVNMQMTKVQKRRVGNITTMTSGSLPCKNIIQTELPNMISELPGRLFEIFEEVERMGYESVSIPAIGTGKYRQSFSVSANVMLKAFLTISRTSTHWQHLKTINVVIYYTYSDKVKVFEDIIFRKIKDMSLLRDPEFKDIESIRLALTSRAESDIQKAVWFLIDERHKRKTTKFWIWDQSLVFMNRAQKGKIDKIGKENNVKIVHAYRFKSGMMLEGKARNVMKVQKLIKKDLVQLARRDEIFDRRNAITTNEEQVLKND